MKEKTIFKEDFDVLRRVDEELMTPGKKIKFGDSEYTLAEINNLIPATENKINLFIEWDNMCQYTALGLVSLLNEISGEKRKIDLTDFFSRKEYPNGIDYVKKIIYPDCKESLIDTLMEKNYDKILLSSPKTSFFVKLDRIRFMLGEVRFMFRHDSPSLKELVDEISRELFLNKVRCEYSVYKTEQEEIDNIIKNRLSNMYVVPDMGLYYKAFLDHEKTDIDILSYETHNGMNPYILSIYLNEFALKDISSLNDINLNFLKEIVTKQEGEQENENRSTEP